MLHGCPKRGHGVVAVEQGLDGSAAGETLEGAARDAGGDRVVCNHQEKKIYAVMCNCQIQSMLPDFFFLQSSCRLHSSEESPLPCHKHTAHGALIPSPSRPLHHPPPPPLCAIPRSSAMTPTSESSAIPLQHGPSQPGFLPWFGSQHQNLPSGWSSGKLHWCSLHEGILSPCFFQSFQVSSFLRFGWSLPPSGFGWGRLLILV